MGAGHAHALYVHEHTPVHHLAPEAKLVAAFAFVVAVAATPRQAVWAFAVYAMAMIVVVRLARLPIGFVAARLLAVVPFVLFALFIPFVASGERTRSTLVAEREVPMGIKFQVTFDCRDVHVMADFWALALGSADNTTENVADFAESMVAMLR